jgi:macrolide-specific efflux system membrane fusion protein
MRVKILAIVLLLVVGGGALLVAFGGLPRGAAAATTYLTATAEVTDVRDDVAATGSIASADAWDLAFGADPVTSGSSDSSSSSGNGAGDTGTWHVTDLKASVGASVKKGDVLATATNESLAASITAARNSWTGARLQELAAKEAFESATTTDAIRQTRPAYLNAQNQTAAARQTLVDLQATAAKNRLVAPADGIVTALNLTSGADAPSGPAITIASASYEVTADVVESDISSMKLAQPASVTVSAIGATLDGTVTAIAPTAESSSGNSSVVSYAVTVSLADPPATIRAGMTADITITTASATNVLAVPAAAVRGVQGNYSVLVMTPAGTPEAHAVTVGLMTSSLVEIQSGLNAGDVVVTGTSSAQRATNNANGGGFAVPGGGGGRVNGGGGPQVIETKP